MDELRPLQNLSVGSRRLVGLALVAAAMVAVLVVAGMRGRAIAGNAVTPPVAPIPQVGDCVTEDANKLGERAFNWSSVPTSVNIERCTGPRFGEVAFVIQDLAAAEASAGTGDDPFIECIRKADEYVGRPLQFPLYTPAQVSPPPTEPLFMPAPNFLITIFGPDARARSAGQEWGACVVYLPDSSVIDHSLQGAWLRQGDNQLFAVCLADPAALVALSCHGPHQFELIGVGSGTPTVTAESIDAACREIAVQALGSPHALESGVLTAQVVGFGPGPNNDGTLISGPAAVSTDSPYIKN